MTKKISQFIFLMCTALLLFSGCGNKAVAPVVQRPAFFNLNTYITEKQKSSVTIVPETIPDAFIQTEFRQEFKATGIDKVTGTWSVSKGELPPGFSLTASSTQKDTAIISGTTTSTLESYTFELTASDSEREGNGLYTITLRSPFTIATDKTSYALNEPIQISVTLYNGDRADYTLPTCPLHYTIEPLLDPVESVQTYASCPITDTFPTIIGRTKSHTWKFTHAHDLFGSSPGQHTVHVDLQGNKNLSATTTITISP